MNGEYLDLLDMSSNYTGDYLESVHHRSVFPENFASKSLSMFDKSLPEQYLTTIERDLTSYELNNYCR